MTRYMDPAAEHERAMKIMRQMNPLPDEPADPDSLFLCESGRRPAKHHATHEFPEHDRRHATHEFPEHDCRGYGFLCSDCASALGVNLDGARVLRSGQAKV